MKQKPEAQYKTEIDQLNTGVWRVVLLGLGFRKVRFVDTEQDAIEAAEVMREERRREDGND